MQHDELKLFTGSICFWLINSFTVLAGNEKQITSLNNMKSAIFNSSDTYAPNKMSQCGT